MVEQAWVFGKGGREVVEKKLVIKKTASHMKSCVESKEKARGGEVCLMEHC